MAQVRFNYFILDSDKVVFESTAQAKLTKKDLKETESFIVEHNNSPEFVDIPGKVYDKFMEKAFEKAMKEYPEVNERYDDLDVTLEQNIPVDLIMQMSDELKRKMLINDPYYMDESDIFPLDTNEDIKNINENDRPALEQVKVEESVTPSDSIVPAEDIRLVATDQNASSEEDTVPTKENTLYLPIKQIYFDAIIEGSKKEEYREIKPTTYKKYLECDENNYPYFDDALIDVDNPLCNDINVWNDGVYPLYPRNYQYLHLVVGYNKERDEAIVKVKEITFEPILDDKGLPFRFDENEEESFKTENGKLCFWNIVYHLDQILKVQRTKKKTATIL